MKKKIILTGGAGFIGSCFLWKLNLEGIDNIIVVDNLGSSEKWRNLSGKRFIDYVQKEDFLEMLRSGMFNDAGCVVHLGACSSTTCTDGVYFIKNNYEYSKTLASWAAGRGVRFVYASSAATYGDGECGYGDQEDRLDDLRPLNMYGYSKHLFDLWMRRNGLLKKAAGIKFFNVFGPNEYHKGDMMSVVCKKFLEVSQKGRVGLFRSYKEGYADGEQKRDFIYVKDVVDVLFYFLNEPEKTGIFNLGCGKAHSWNELAGAMFAALDKELRVDYIDMPETLRDKYQYFTEAKMDKLRKSGYAKAFTPLEYAVRDYICYLKEGGYL